MKINLAVNIEDKYLNIMSFNKIFKKKMIKLAEL